MPQLIATVEDVEIKRISLTRDRLTLGRKPGNDIVLDNPSVSGHHCVFEVRGVADVFVEDLRSTNGTFLNGARLTARTKLRDEDVLSIVNFRVRFVADSNESVESGFSASQTQTFALPVGAQQGGVKASFHVINGATAGLEVPLVKMVTTFGKPGALVVAVSQRRDGYYVARVEGEQVATVNQRPVGHEGVLLSNHDVLDLAGTKMLFHMK